MARVIITRGEARKQGLSRYFTGKACKRGHVDERYVSNLDCVSCVYERSKANAWYKRNRERHNANSRAWYAENSEKLKATRDRWYRDHPNYSRDWARAVPPEERKARKRAWYEANREYAIAYTAEWARRNPEAAKQVQAVVAHRRRARKAASPGQHTRADLAAILAAQGHWCANCRTDLRKAEKHVDHIIPLARGGSNDKGNLQFLCRACNLAKAARDPIEFAQAQGRLL